MPNNNNNTWISRRQQSVGDFFRTLRNFAVSAMPENIKTFLRIEQESDSKNLINNLENDLRKENVRRDKIETEAMKDIEIYIQQKDRKIRKADNLEDIVYLAKKTASRTGRDFDICIELESTGIDYDHDWNPIARNEEPRILRIVAHKNGRVEFFKAIRGYESMPVENMPAELKYKDLKQAMYTTGYMNGSKRHKKECANPSGISSLSKEILLEKDLREQAAEIISNRKLGEGEKIANVYKLVNYYRDNFGYPVNPEDDGASGRSCFCVNLQGKTGNKEYEMQFLKGDIRLAEKGTADASVSFLKMSGREKHDILATRIGLGNPYPQEFKQHFFELINEAIQADKADRKENVIRKRTRSGYKTITTEEERRVHFNIGKLKCSALSLGDGRYEIKCAGQRFSIDERKKMDANLQKLYNLGRSNNGNVIARVSEKAIDEKEYLVNYLNTHGTKSRDGSTVVLLPMPGKRNRFVTVSEKDGEITCGADMSASGAKRILNMMQKETDISDIASSMRAEENSFGVNVRDVNLDSTKDEFDISKKINETKTVFLNRQDTVDMQRNIELGLGSLAKGNISTEDYCAYVCKLATDNGNIVEFTTGKDLFSTDKSTGSHVCTYYIIPKKSGEPAYMKRDRTETRYYGKDGKAQLTVSKRDAIASKEEFLDAIDKIQRNVIVENGDPINSLKKEVERLTSQFQENVGSGMDDLTALNMLKEGLEKYKETINENRDAASRAIRKSFRIVHGESESAIDLQSENNRLENSNGIIEAERDSRSGVPQRNVGGER